MKGYRKLQIQYFLNLPNMIRNTCLHCWCHSQYDDALALLLAFGSATWRKDFHLASSAPCLAHT